MSIQPVSNTANPYANTLSSDFQTLQDDIQAYEKAQGSGNSDQVTLSKKALNQAMAQFQNDLASLSSQPQGTQGHHHHHHHHGMDPAGSGGSTGTVIGISTDASNSYGSQSQNSTSTINLTA